MVRTLVVTLIAVLFATSADAQSPYIGAAAAADIARFSGSQNDILGGGGGISGNGDAVGWSVRAGTPIGDRWGLDVEFDRGGRIKSDLTFPFPRLVETFPPNVITGGSVFPGINTGSLITWSSSVPSRLDLSRRDRFSTISTSLWFHHELTPRFSLIYLGGIAFLRAERESSILVPNFVCVNTVPGVPQLCRDMIDVQTQELVSYSAGPSVGADLRVGVTERLSVVPGVRLLAIDASGQRGWLVRPSVGVQWSF